MATHLPLSVNHSVSLALKQHQQLSVRHLSAWLTARQTDEHCVQLDIISKRIYVNRLTWQPTARRCIDRSRAGLLYVLTVKVETVEICR